MDALKKALGLDVPTSTSGMVTGSLLMLALLLIAFPLAWSYGGRFTLALLCGLAFMFIVVTGMAGIAISTSRREAERVRQMLAGEHWAHWQYGNDDLEQFSQHEAARTRRDMRASFIFAVVFGLVVGTLMGLLIHSPFYGLVFGGFAFLLGIALVLQDSSKGKAYVFPTAGAQEVYIGPGGVYQQGKFCTFAYLKDVKLESDSLPQTLLFDTATSSYLYRSPATRRKETVTNTVPVRVGVPRGHEAEAEQLVVRFKATLAEGAQAAF